MVTLEPPRRMPGTVDPWIAVGFTRAAVTGFLRRARRAMGMQGEVDVLLAADATLRRLNREFRGKDKATDVLSFPAGNFAEGRAGDLAVSFETAARQADRFGHTVLEEVCVLVLHGLLHLDGMDHEVDSGEMAAREAGLRARLRLPVGLIARVTANAKAAKGATVREGKRKSGNARGAMSQRDVRDGKRKSRNAMDAMFQRNVRGGKTERVRVVAR